MGDDAKESSDYFVPPTLTNEYVLCQNRSEKIFKAFNFLLNFAKEQKIILFVNTCACVDFYGKVLQNLFYFKDVSVDMIHGKMKQKKRNKIFESFLKKNLGILISTDLIARGLDFLDIGYILQIDPPQVNLFVFLIKNHSKFVFLIKKIHLKKKKLCFFKKKINKTDKFCQGPQFFRS